MLRQPDAAGEVAIFLDVTKLLCGVWRFRRAFPVRRFFADIVGQIEHAAKLRLRSGSCVTLSEEEQGQRECECHGKSLQLHNWLGLTRNAKECSLEERPQ